LPAFFCVLLRFQRFVIASLVAFSFAAVAEVTAKDAWIRGTVPAQRTTGAYLTLTSTEPVKLVAVATPAAQRVEMHEMAMNGGVMQMRALDFIALPAKRPVVLGPGAQHLMLIELGQPLAAGAKVPLRLTLETGDGKRTTLEVSAEVRPLTEPTRTR
jgi:copper(I)-binding protein